MLPVDIAEQYDVLVHFTPTTDQRKALAKSGAAMPDGSFYIRNRSDLSNAISAVGRATPNANESETARRNAVRRHIMNRARDLKLETMIPDTWNSDGTLKQGAILIDEIEEYLSHFGVRGMHWGVRRHRNGVSRGKSVPSKVSTHHVSGEAARAAELQARVKQHGTRSLSNQELKDLTTRLQLVNQHGKLDPGHVTAGKRVTNELLDIGGKAAKGAAIAFATQYAAKGLAELVKLAAKR